MKAPGLIALSLLTLTLLLGGCDAKPTAGGAVAPTEGSVEEYGEHNNWGVPPRRFRLIQRLF